MAVCFSVLVLFIHIFNNGSCICTVIRGGWPMDNGSILHFVYSRYVKEGKRFID